jgi:hypothetical protein
LKAWSLFSWSVSTFKVSAFELALIVCANDSINTIIASEYNFLIFEIIVGDYRLFGFVKVDGVAHHFDVDERIVNHSILLVYFLLEFLYFDLKW